MLYILKITESHLPQIIGGVLLLFTLATFGIYYANMEDKRREKEERRKVIIDAKLDQDLVSLDEFERRLS